MVRIEQEQDIEVLRQVARLLEGENRRLHARIEALAREIASLKGQDSSKLQFELDYLKDLLARREQSLFGDSSERRIPGAESGATSDPSDPSGAESSRPRRPGHGPRKQPRLPVVEETHELPADDRQCSACGGEVTEMGDQFEESEEISVVERQFVIVKHRRRKYRCRCNGCVRTAPAPPKLQPGSRYSLAFAVEVAVAKYLDHLPLERQSRIMAREGLEIDSQTLWDQINALARHLEPTYQALRAEILEDPLVHADETWWRLMGSTKKRWWVWAVQGESAIYCRLLESRSTSAAREMLDGYEGTVLADGYGAYRALARDRGGGSGFQLAHCLAHARRKFVEAEESFPEAAQVALEKIRALYLIEREVPRAHLEDDAEMGAARLRLRAELRDRRSRPIMAEFRAWMESLPVLPESALGRAVRYARELWPGLTRFLDDPRIPLDNNALERSLRGVVLGRKNHLGSRSKRGLEVAALYYSLIETAKLRGAEPKGYLIAAARAAIAAPGAVTLP